MRWFGVILCVVSAYRLSGTPLQVFAWIVAVSSGLIAVGATVSTRIGERRVVTALQHVSIAMGGFLLFVSLAI
jgi:hypothetical protein